MLAQNFMTAAELELTDSQYEGLVKTLGVLERGEVRHVPVEEDWTEWDYDIVEQAPSMLFNMDNFFAKTKNGCGTAGCIAGTCDWLFKTKFVANGHPDSIDELFYPPLEMGKWQEITVPQAAQALRNYLTSGKPRWDEVVEGCE